mgnify:CR=1 FL=1
MRRCTTIPLRQVLAHNLHPTAEVNHWILRWTEVAMTTVVVEPYEVAAAQCAVTLTRSTESESPPPSRGS